MAETLGLKSRDLYLRILFSPKQVILKTVFSHISRVLWQFETRSKMKGQV